uniref:Uncharacterized protein n=1 Tax=Arundo donax TaxID=35708 RepID=A0A0A9GMJ8_ARUDO
MAHGAGAGPPPLLCPWDVSRAKVHRWGWR